MLFCKSVFMYEKREPIKTPLYSLQITPPKNSLNYIKEFFGNQINKQGVNYVQCTNECIEKRSIFFFTYRITYIKSIIQYQPFPKTLLAFS